MSANVSNLLYLIAGILFILALRGLSHPTTSRQGNLYGMIGMGIAIVTTLAFNRPAGFGGAGPRSSRARHRRRGWRGDRAAGRDDPDAATRRDLPRGRRPCGGGGRGGGALCAPGVWHRHIGTIKGGSLFEMALGVAIGAITFTGSIIAGAKLNGNMSGKPIMLPQRHALNIGLAVLLVLCIAWLIGAESRAAFWLIVLVSFVLGVTLIIPIGGADMPVVVSMLNSYSGWAAAGIGFTLGNLALIITGSLVGSSGAILSYIMCKGMNRSFISVILGGFGGEVAGPAGAVETRPVKQGSADDAAYIMKNAGKVIIVPGYGMAVAQAQHALREMADQLKEEGVEIKYAIHPVAGRMPGHMNVLLAEANVPYDEVFELEDVNSEFAQADVAFVIGANDVTNPSAKTDPQSPIFGMPILDVDRAKTVLFIKRGMGSGYAGVENELFFRDNTMMLFGDAKKVVDDVLKAL